MFEQTSQNLRTPLGVSLTLSTNDSYSSGISRIGRALKILVLVKGTSLSLIIEKADWLSTVGSKCA